MNKDIKNDYEYEEWKKQRSPLQDNSLYKYLKSL